jgi:hypothetical protein
MTDTIELAIESPDGVIDCMLEAGRNAADELFYSATILYPKMINGISRPEIFCLDLINNGGSYVFDESDTEVHPKVKQLEAQLSGAILAAR